jgi:hypothetical protein
VVNQFYEAEIMTEYVIRGNTALLKCSIPSFVADFVQVESWVDDEGKIYVASEDYGKLSRYVPFDLYFVCTLMLTSFQIFRGGF